MHPRLLTTGEKGVLFWGGAFFEVHCWESLKDLGVRLIKAKGIGKGEGEREEVGGGGKLRNGSNEGSGSEWSCSERSGR